MATIQEVYIALFGRPADPIGYDYYVEATNDGANLDAVGDLSASPEYTERFEGLTDVQMINQIYQDLFGRDADADGLLFYVQLLRSGEASMQDIAIRILDGATGTDQDIIDNKVAAANLFTESLNTGSEIVAYQGDAAADAGRAFLSTVTADDASIPTQAEVDAFIADIDTGVVTPGDTIILTDQVGEVADGTDGNDEFSAVLSGATGTLNTGDRLSGFAGRDVLNLVVAADGTLPAGVDISGIEVINIIQDATNELDAIDAGDFEGAEEIWQEGATTGAAITGVDGQTIGFRDTAIAAGDVVTVADGVTSASVALDNVTTGGTVAFDETTNDDLTSVSVSGDVATTGNVTVDTATATTAVDTINLALTSDGTVTLTADVAVLTTIDASGSTGDLAINASTITALEVFNGGSGGDTLTANLAVVTNETLTINSGAGIDTINLAIDGGAAATAVTLTGGEGGDTFVLTSAGAFPLADGNLVAVADVEDLEESLITISDFDGSEDVLDFTDIAVDGTAQNVVNNAITAAAADDLREAVVAAASVTADGEFSLFEFGGSTYFYAETGAAGGLDAGDTLIELAGVNIADLNGDNFL